MLKKNLSIFFALAALLLSSAMAQEASIWEEASHTFAMEDAVLSGPGAEWLSANLSDTQSVLVGEQHGVDGLARFTTALEARFAPDILVLEAGPWIGGQISENGVREALSFAPYSLAFDYNGDIALIERFQARAGAAGEVWGVDQESNAIHPLAWIAQNSSDGTARRLARGLHLKSALDGGEYSRNDHSTDLLALSDAASDAPVTRQLLAHLETSMNIFVTWRSGARSDAAVLREQYMIDRYEARRAAFEAEQNRAPRSLFKMGGAPIMEGETGPNGVMTLGEHVQRRANSEGATALHLGVRGYNPETTPYPIGDLIEGERFLLLDTQIIRTAMEAGTLSELSEDTRTDIQGYDALGYINPLSPASNSQIQSLKADFRSGLYTSLALHFWPMPFVLIAALFGTSLLVRRGFSRQGYLLSPVMTLTVVSTVTLAIFLLQLLALISTSAGAAEVGPAQLAYVAPILAVLSLIDTLWRGRTGARAPWIAGLVWAGLLLWLTLAMHRWNFGGMLA